MLETSHYGGQHLQRYVDSDHSAIQRTLGATLPREAAPLRKTTYPVTIDPTKNTPAPFLSSTSTAVIAPGEQQRAPSSSPHPARWGTPEKLDHRSVTKTPDPLMTHYVFQGGGSRDESTDASVGDCRGTLHQIDSGEQHYG